MKKAQLIKIIPFIRLKKPSINKQIVYSHYDCYLYKLVGQKDNLLRFIYLFSKQKLICQA